MTEENKVAVPEQTREQQLEAFREQGICLVDEVSQMPYFQIPPRAKPIGGEDDEDDDVRLSLPKLAILGTNSKALSKDSKVEGAELGMFYNPTLGELYDGDEGVTVVPLFMFKERFYNKPPFSLNRICTSKDGKGKYGITTAGNYEEHGIPTVVVKDGAEFVVGTCKKCPHQQRMMGQKAACSLVKNIVCVRLGFIEEAKKIIERIKDSDGRLEGDILMNIFVLPFKSTGLTILEKMTTVIYNQGSYMGRAWRITTETKPSEQYTWEGYVLHADRALTPEEEVIAFTIMTLCKNVRPIISDIDVAPNTSSLATTAPSPVEKTDTSDLLG